MIYTIERLESMIEHAKALRESVVSERDRLKTVAAYRAGVVSTSVNYRLQEIDEMIALETAFRDVLVADHIADDGGMV